MDSDKVADNETVIRHIPGGTTFQAPGPRITSKNFELRVSRGETGISVSRTTVTTADQLMARVGNPSAGSRIAIASVADIRSLGLEIVPDPKDYDIGHAEIRSAVADLSSQAVRKQLVSVFHFLPFPISSGSGSSNPDPL